VKRVDKVVRGTGDSVLRHAGIEVLHDILHLRSPAVGIGPVISSWRKNGILLV